jgi:hypothetical protein
LLHVIRFSVACAPDKGEHILMSDENRSWIITEAVNARQIALKDSDHQFQLACDVQQKHVGGKELGNLIV